jgi:hypothetical protein
METKRTSAKVVVSVLALAGLLLFSVLAPAGNLEPGAPPAPTMKTLDEVEPRIPIHGSDLPLTITEPNSYYLAETMHFGASGHAITIECNGVTIDLMGFSLIGPGKDAGTAGNGIHMGGSCNVDIRNGTVRDFGNRGIRQDSYSWAKGVRIIGVRALSNGQDGISVGGRGGVVKDCIATSNGRDGIHVGACFSVVGNAAYDNKAEGFQVGNSSTVNGNAAHGNGTDGIAAWNSLVAENAAYGNGGVDINGMDSTLVNNHTGP